MLEIREAEEDPRCKNGYDTILMHITVTYNLISLLNWGLMPYFKLKSIRHEKTFSLYRKSQRRLGDVKLHKTTTRENSAYKEVYTIVSVEYRYHRPHCNQAIPLIVERLLF